MSGFEPLAAGAAETALADAALWDASAGLTAGAAGAGTAGIGTLMGALGDGTAMGAIPEAGIIPGANSLTPALKAANPQAYDQVASALKTAQSYENPMQYDPNVMANAAMPAPAAPPAPNPALAAANSPATIPAYKPQGIESLADIYGGPASKPGILDDLGDIYSKIPKELKYAGMGYSALQLLNADRNKYGTPAQEKYTGPLSKFSYDPSRYIPTVTPQPTPYTPVRYAYAEGGIASLGGYSDGGRMLKGPGDGMSDSIPATISNKQPARLADGEFVVPADVVSHLGNGSTDAGAKQLYKMMDKVRVARTGKRMQGRQINPHKYMPA